MTLRKQVRIIVLTLLVIPIFLTAGCDMTPRDGNAADTDLSQGSDASFPEALSGTWRFTASDGDYKQWTYSTNTKKYYEWYENTLESSTYTRKLVEVYEDYNAYKLTSMNELFIYYWAYHIENDVLRLYALSGSISKNDPDPGIESFLDKINDASWKTSGSGYTKQ